MKAINEACRSKGGHYATYSCQVVSWDDVSRGTTGGSLSCWGANITDTYLKSKTGQRLFTVRSDNWNEKLGVVSADEVAVVASRTGGTLQPVTLRNVLQQMGAYGSYAGLEGQTDLSNAALDAQCSIRFQTTFIPVEESSGGRGKLEFATEAYNYNTTSDSDPRNLVLLCTSQGMAVQQDGRGSKRLFHHAVEGNGKIHRYWLEAEESSHKVGGEQRESDQERAEALARGKATSSVIGVRAMGQRFNVLMTVQVPLQQQPRRQPQLKGGGLLAGLCAAPALFSSSKNASGDSLEACMENDCDDCMEMESAPQLQSLEFKCRSTAVRRSAPAPKGLSSAARVSRGTEHDVWKGLSIKSPKRNGTEHVTVTVVIYNAVRGGVPTPQDVAAAIDDLEGLYRACADTGRLADTKFDFMKEQLKVDDMMDITTKIAFQPPAVDVLQHDVFPAA
ncbi:unc-104 [Symbiodinium sp. CCMP2456]|nr:unc-104 [Symbiodinium sp. CCMP2456]